jgi:hypothetical protein
MPGLRGLPPVNVFARGAAPAPLALANDARTLASARAATLTFAPRSPLVAHLHQAEELRWAQDLAAWVEGAPEALRPRYEDAAQRTRAAHDTPFQTTLDLAELGLLTLPPGLHRLAHLRFLYVNDNPITELPAELVELRALEDLELRNTNITALPFAPRDLPRLRHLGTRGTPVPAYYRNTWPRATMPGSCLV